MSANKLLDPIKPGEILREDFMEPLGISINQLSRDLSVPPNRISEIVNGKRSITADTALRLQRYFGVEAQFWLNLQTEYDLRMIKRNIWSDIERRIIPVKTTETGIEHSAEGLDADGLKTAPAGQARRSDKKKTTNKVYKCEYF